MVYINSSGQVVDGNKISWRRPVESVKEIFGIFVLFFFSLISPLTQLVNPNSGGSSSSGSSGGNFRSSGRSNDSNRRGGFRTMSDIRPPPFIGGGCSGGMCG